MRRHWLSLGLAATIAAVILPTRATAQGQVTSAQNPGSLRLPFHLKEGHILVDGQVDDTPGVFMLDTGTPFDFFLNRDFVPLPPGRQIAKGAASSGQPITVQLHQGDRVLRLSGIPDIASSAVRSGELGFVADELKTRFLGFVGVGFLKRYAFTIDYAAHVVTLVPVGPDPALLPGEHQPVAILHFDLKDQGPTIPLEVSGLTIPAILDTGAAGDASLTAATRDKLLAARRLAIRRRGQMSILGIHGLQNDQLRFDQTYLEDKGSAANAITLGYRFLHHYKSTWNYQSQTIALFRNRAEPSGHGRPRLKIHPTVQ